LIHVRQSPLRIVRPGGQVDPRRVNPTEVRDPAVRRLPAKANRHVPIDRPGNRADRAPDSNRVRIDQSQISRHRRTEASQHVRIVPQDRPTNLTRRSGPIRVRLNRTAQETLVNAAGSSANKADLLRTSSHASGASWSPLVLLINMHHYQPRPCARDIRPTLGRFGLLIILILEISRIPEAS